MAFTGFPRAAFDWFAGLEADNTRAYFTAARDVYESSVRGALGDMLEELAGEHGGAVHMFRQHRDVRFSPDKSPYKTTTYGLIVDRPGSRAALYAQLSARGLFAGTGYHVLAADQLERMREAIADERSGPTLERAVAAAEAAGLEVFGEALKVAPRGYPRDHPRVRLLRHRSLVAGRQLAPGAGGIGRDAALAHARAAWAACEPMVAWLDRHVGMSELPPARPRGRPR